jgi:hypothetical protein
MDDQEQSPAFEFSNGDFLRVNKILTDGNRNEAAK